MKKSLSLFLFSFLIVASKIFSQNVLDSLHTNFFASSYIGFPTNYSFQRTNGSFNPSVHNGYGFDLGLSIRIRKNFYFRTGIQNQNISFSEKGTDTTYYSSTGIIGHSDLTYNQNLVMTYVGFMIPLGYKKWIFDPKIDLGISFNGLVQKDNIAKTKTSIGLDGGYVFSPGFKFGYQLKKKIFIWLGYDYCKTHCTIENTDFNKNNIPYHWIQFDGHLHTLDIGISLNIRK